MDAQGPWNAWARAMVHGDGAISLAQEGIQKMIYPVNIQKTMENHHV
jgi:hypothetical protein